VAEPDYYTATENLYVGWALAHAAGDSVPAENVKANGWEDKVARKATKAAEAARPKATRKRVKGEPAPIVPPPLSPPAPSPPE
jgi:hypothetical protein